MEQSLPAEGKSEPSLLLANLGWIASAGVAIWFFVFAGPASSRAGAAQGIADQNAHDKQVYETAFGAPVTATPLPDTINIRAVRLQPQGIVGQPLVFNGNNPFTTEPKQKLVLYDAQTRFVRRVVLSPEEFQRRTRAAIARGENPLLIAPFDDQDTTADTVKEGDRLEVIARDAKAIDADSFMADFIAVVVEPSSKTP